MSTRRTKRAPGGRKTGGTGPSAVRNEAPLEDKPAWCPTNLSGPEYVPIAGALFYAIGWAAATRFYGRFKVQPEEVGIDFGFILVRVGFILTFLLFVGYIIWVLSVRIHSLNFSDRMARAIHNVVLALVLMAIPVVLLRVAPWENRMNVGVAIIATVGWLLGLLLAGILVVGPLGDAMGYQRDTHKYIPKPLSTRWLPLIGVLAVLAVVAATFMHVEHAADAVRSGEPFTIYAAPGLRGLTVQEVRPDVDSSVLDAARLNEHCLLLLGAGGSFVVLYDAEDDRVYRLAPELVTIRSGC